jgi:hypothetical protein
MPITDFSKRFSAFVPVTDTTRLLIELNDKF